MNDDAALLRRYAGEGSEAAFAELVRRHLDLVYGAALRRTGDPHRASDVAQQVFTSLARHARRLSRHPMLVAWLHTATRHAALNLMISEQRRRKRESEALALDAVNAPEPAADWAQVRPLLDAAIDELPEADRAAVVMRFLNRSAFAEIGMALRVSEEAARKRTERALEKLRVALARRGITSTAAALGALVAGQAAIAAPAGLAVTLAAQATATAGSATLAATVAAFMTGKLITTATVGLVLGFLAGSRPWQTAATPTSATAVASSDAARQQQEAATLRRDHERLAAERTMLQAEIARLNAANAALAAAAEAAPPPSPARTENITLGLARWEIQLATLNNLRQIDASRQQYLKEHGRVAGSVHDLIGRGGYMKTLRTVNGEDYAKLSMNPTDPLTVATPNGIEVTYDPVGPRTTKPEFPEEVLRARQLGAQIQPAVDKALAAYRVAHAGLNPPDEQALVPYFATPKEGADFVEAVEAQKAAGL